MMQSNNTKNVAWLLQPTTLMNMINKNNPGDTKMFLNEITIENVGEWKQKIIDSLIELIQADNEKEFGKTMSFNLLEMVKLLTKSVVVEDDLTITIEGDSETCKEKLSLYHDSLTDLLCSLDTSKVDWRSKNCPLFCIATLIRAVSTIPRQVTDALKPLSIAS